MVSPTKKAGHGGGHLANGVNLGVPIDQPLSPFQEVHKKIQEARNRIREEQEKDEALRKERLEREDERKGFDRQPRVEHDGV